MLRLLTIPISHFCEKARWALDRAAVAYREERHVQGIHRVAARRAGAGPTVPVLVCPEGVIGESHEIIAWADRRLPGEHRLLPAQTSEREQVQRLCRRLDGELGPRGRRLLYVHMLAQRRLAVAFNNQGVPRWEERAVRWGWPLITRYLKRELAIFPGSAAEDEAAVFAELDYVAQLLADGRPYLCGARFTAADLTFACMSASLTLPPGYGVALPAIEQLAPSTAALVRRVREHAAGAYALALFERRRGERVA